jgi:hypothetical protein
MDPQFFRKYADIITEASMPTDVLPLPKREAKVLQKLVDRISAMRDDHGFEWLNSKQGPLHDAWRAYFDSEHHNDMDFSDFLLQAMPPQLIVNLASQAQGIYNDAKLDIYY